MTDESSCYWSVYDMFKFVKICMHMIILYSFYLIGNWIQESLGLFIPGSVIGMLLLFTLLLFTGFKQQWIEDGALFFIHYLPLFFIPATAGIINYFHLFTGKGLLLLFIVLISTALVMSVSGLVSQKLALGKRRMRNE